MNINDTVWAYLTAKGENVLRKYYEKYTELPPQYSPAYFISTHRDDVYDKNQGLYHFSMWELMHIFGPEMVMGLENCFVDCEIFFEHPLRLKAGPMRDDRGA